MIGHEKLQKDFEKLIENNRLSHAYLFFGESQLGKFLFASSLANFLEYGVFEAPTKILKEVLIVEPNEKGIIGIEEVRNLTHFLYQKPIFSEKRAVIIRDAENLTSEAQNAILKIVEDHPARALIIFIALGEDLLLPALISRLQKIYFSRVAQSEIENFLISSFGAEYGKKEIKSAADESFGRPGRAIDILRSKESEEIEKMIKDFKQGSSEVIEKIAEGNPDKFFEFLIIDLRNNYSKNLVALQEVLKRSANMKMFNTNKKLQLKAIQRYV